MSERHAYLNAIGCAVPDHDIHGLFMSWAAEQLEDEGDRALFRRMARQSGIDHRWSVLPEHGQATCVSPGGFYGGEAAPSTSERMGVYQRQAPDLAMRAIAALGAKVELAGITHLVVASCTGFVAPGVDQIIAQTMGLTGVERTLIGFMGCYAAVIALRTARHIVRSEPDARVLVVTVELSSLHLQRETHLEPLLAMLQFGDGAAAALVTSHRSGFEIRRQFALTIPATTELISWSVGDSGFSMHLSGEVPRTIAETLDDEQVRTAILGKGAGSRIDCWAIHPGGRTILKAVERGFRLDASALEASYDVLRRFGNMSSSTLMFVLSELLAGDHGRAGIALAFGPGLAAEGFEFERPV